MANVLVVDDDETARRAARRMLMNLGHNTGSTFDARGRMRNWWTPDDSTHFAASTEALARQYDTYRPFPDLAINGHLTLSENIVADLTCAGAGMAPDGPPPYLRMVVRLRG